MANTNRTKGHNAERHYRTEFRNLGYSYCETSRYASRHHDDAKIDLINVPFNVQIKAGFQKGMNPSKVLREMSEAIELAFPPDSTEHEKVNILIHRKQCKQGKARTEYDDLVTLTWDDLKKLIKRLEG